MERPDPGCDWARLGQADNGLVDLYLETFDRVLTGADKSSRPYRRYYIGAVNTKVVTTIIHTNMYVIFLSSGITGIIVTLATDYRS